MDDTKKPKRSEVMRFIRKLSSRRRSLGPLAKLRRKRQVFIASSQRQGAKIAKEKREAYLMRNMPEGLTVAVANGHPL